MNYRLAIALVLLVCVVVGTAQATSYIEVQIPNVTDTWFANGSYSNIVNGWYLNASLNNATPTSGTFHGYGTLAGKVGAVRLEVDLGSPQTITRIDYNNYASSGGSTTRGAKDAAHTLHGSNTEESYFTLQRKNPGYQNDTGWTVLTTDTNQFEQHNDANAADWKNITVTSPGAYRFYAIDIDSNWGDANYLAMGRLRFMIEYTPPIASFSGNKTTSAIYGFPVLFTNSTSVDQTTAWFWDFGDGNTSTQQQPTHVYSVAGNYTVNASFTNSTAQYWVNQSVFVNQTSDWDADLKSWLHLNGTDGGTIFVDQIGSAWSPVSATTSTTQKKFGEASGLFTVAASKISTPAASQFNFSTNPFTIEAWVYPTSSANKHVLVSRLTNPNAMTDGWALYHSTSSTASDGWVFYMGSAAAGSTGTFGIPLNKWSHVVVERVSNGTAYVYVNGTIVASKPGLTGNYDTQNPVVWGDAGGSTSSFRGYLDEVRMSTNVRWGATQFNPPQLEYRGDLFPVYPDPNPGSTLRYKTDPEAGGSVVMVNLTPRYRTIQIQNINMTNNISTTVRYNPKYVYANQVVANNTVFATGINFTKILINQATGTVLINATRPGGFSTTGLADNRGSFADIRFVYYNYSNPNSGGDVYPGGEFFGQGFLKNSTTSLEYPVHNFIGTNVSFDNWTTFANFTINNKAPMSNEQEVTFIPENNVSASRYFFDFGDGTTFTSYNGTTKHIYSSAGTYTVAMTAYLWQNTSVTNTTEMFAAVSPVYNQSYVKADFSGNPLSGQAGLLVTFTDMSIWGATDAVSGRSYNWSFGDGQYSDAKGGATHVYSALGTYSVNLTVNNTLSTGDYELKTNYIILSANQQTTWYTPRQVEIKTVNVYGNAVPGVFITATPINFTAPEDWAQILVGIQPSVNMSGTTLYGFTGTDGSWVAPVLQSYMYHFTFRNGTSGINQEATFYPSDTVNRIWLNTGGNVVNNTYNQIAGSNLTFSEPDINHVILGMNYHDVSGLTTMVNFTVVSRANNTVMYHQSFTSGMQTGVVSSETFQNIRGEEFIWKYEAYRSDGSYLSQGNGVSMKGPNGVLVDLGLPIDWYRWMSISVLFLMGSLASQRTKQYWGLLIPLFAALFAWFGWFTGQTTLWGIIVLCCVLGAIIYMKSSLREKFGVGGPGSMLLNIVIYLILLQACIGFINGLAVWEVDANAAIESQYFNVEITRDVPNIQSAGNFLGDVIGASTALFDITFSMLKVLVSILTSIVSIYPTISTMFPWMLQSSQTVALLALLQIGIWILYAFFLWRLYKGEIGTVEV